MVERRLDNAIAEMPVGRCIASVTQRVGIAKDVDVGGSNVKQHDIRSVSTLITGDF